MTARPAAVVVFGASGFIGRNIVDALAGEVETLIGVTGRTPTVPGCTLTVPADRVADIPPLPVDSVVVNVAAKRYDARSFRDDQTEILRHNVEIANAVYAFCITRKITEVRLASSVAVYPASWDVLDDERALDLDDWPHAGEAAYAWSKRWAEICAGIFDRQAGIKTQVFRLSNPYGAYDATDAAVAHVAPAFVIRALAPGDTFEILGNPEAERDFVFAGDVARVFAASLARRGATDACNLGYGTTVTIRRLAEAALRAAGREKAIVVTGGMAAGVSVRRVTAARVRAAYPVGPFADLDQGLAATAAWYRTALRP